MKVRTPRVAYERESWGNCALASSQRSAMYRQTVGPETMLEDNTPSMELAS